MAEHRDRLIGFGLLALWAVYCTWGWWGTWGIDGSALYFAGALWADGTPAAIYPPPPEFFWTATPPAWDAIATAKGYPSAELSPYVYPPIWAAVLAPVTGLLTAQGFFNLLTALTFAALALGVWAAHSITRPQRGGFALWAGLSIVVLHSSVAVQFGVELKQPQILISVGTLVVVWLMQRGRGLSAVALPALLLALPSRSAILIGTCLILAQSYRLTLWIFDQGASPYWPMFLGFGGAVATLYLLSQPPGLTKGQADPTVPRID